MRNFLTEKGSLQGTPPNDGIPMELPTYFTNPFSYTPHPLCIEAAAKIRGAISADTPLHNFLMKEGKMFGVLVAESPQGERGYLAAHSGVLVKSTLEGFFVPPVYDLLSPDSFFPEGEAEINALNQEISALENDIWFKEYTRESALIRESHMQKIETLKEIYRKGKGERDALRRKNQGATDEEINRESQFQKGEIRRAEMRMKGELSQRTLVEQERYRLIEEKKLLRKEKSIALQKKIFEHFSFLNALGEEKNLLEIFGNEIPPAGAGECAAPRLLQYAYLHGYRPLAMGEFWYGGTNSSELRRDGHFYPSCKGKCGPILGFMLQGLEVDPSNYHSQYGLESAQQGDMVKVLYKDEYLAVMDKPQGMLSVPGKDDSGIELDKILGDMGEKWIAVHRLDMHTSGILLAAGDMDTYKVLQRQFHCREVEKEYHAVLDGEVSPETTGDCVVWRTASKGEISIPLAPDYCNRPLQKGDFVNGKEAFTRFEVLKVEKGKTYIKFYPVTGRTHQLRVHSAHPRGLDAPISGDLLYGTESTRMMLHAYSIRFIHPHKGEMEIVAPHPDNFPWP